MCKLPVRHSAGTIIATGKSYVVEIVSTTTFKNGCAMRKTTTCQGEPEITDYKLALEMQAAILDLYRKGGHL